MQTLSGMWDQIKSAVGYLSTSEEERAEAEILARRHNQTFQRTQKIIKCKTVGDLLEEVRKFKNVYHPVFDRFLPGTQIIDIFLNGQSGLPETYKILERYNKLNKRFSDYVAATKNLQELMVVINAIGPIHTQAEILHPDQLIVALMQLNKDKFPEAYGLKNKLNELTLQLQRDLLNCHDHKKFLKILDGLPRFILNGHQFGPSDILQVLKPRFDSSLQHLFTINRFDTDEVEEGKSKGKEKTKLADDTALHESKALAAALAADPSPEMLTQYKVQGQILVCDGTPSISAIKKRCMAPNKKPK